MNGRSYKSTAILLGIATHTARNYAVLIRLALNCGSKEQILEYVHKSGNYRQINERYIDLRIFNEFKEALEKVKALKKPLLQNTSASLT